jgi:hypothetical protein
MVSYKVDTKYGRKDGFTYEIKNGEAKILGYTWQDDRPIIPSAVENCTVTKIADFAFQYNDFIKRIKLPDILKEIGTNAFSDCTALTEIKIPEGITFIDLHAFTGCAKLASVTIAASVKSISGDAFMNCRALTDVYFLSHDVNIAPYAFDGCGVFTVHCYEGSTAHDFAIETNRPIVFIK